MGEYEDRYPDAYGHGEVIEPDSERHFSGVGLPRQTRDPAPRPGPETRPVSHPHHPPAKRVFIVRRARDICEDVTQQLNDSPFIDASGIVVTVDDSEVTLEGTINSLMAISLAQALVSNIAGVSRVQVRLRVLQTPRTYETAATPVRTLAE
jgi:hypothetical protein